MDVKQEILISDKINIVSFFNKNSWQVSELVLESRRYGLPGGPLVFQVGYHPRKRTFKTHPKHVFFMYENRP